jgi:hypothetical protein
MELAYALLVGAVLGSLTTLAAQWIEYRRLKQSAGRAVALEMMQNAAYAQAALDGQPVTLFPRAIFDRELNLIAALLSSEDFRRSTSPYLKLTATNEVLRVYEGQDLLDVTDRNVRETAETAQRDFADAADALSAKVWSTKERAALAEPRGR